MGCHYRVKIIVLLLSAVALMLYTANYAIILSRHGYFQRDWSKIIIVKKSADLLVGRAVTAAMSVPRNECVSFTAKLKDATKGPLGIPKIIHQVYKSTYLPQQYMKFITKCREMNKDFVHVLWTDADFMQFLQKTRPAWVPIFKR